MENNNNGAAPNDFEYESIPLEISIEDKLKQLARLSDSGFIYRVPERLRCLYPNIYTPKVVSIGPLHHGNEILKDMEEHKYRYLSQFLGRNQQNLQFYIREVRSQETKLRRYYAERINFDTDEFVSIILLDSAFIIQLFLNYFNIFSEKKNAYPAADKIITTPWMIADIILDLLLLENQVPFFILEILCDLNPIHDPDEEDGKHSFIQLFCFFFRDTLKDIGLDYDLQKETSGQIRGNHDKIRGNHFIDEIVRNRCQPSEPLVLGRRKFTAPSITELHQVGVKLKVSSTRNLFSIRFINGMLEIPKFVIEYLPILRNLAEFEQCRYLTDYHPISDYIILLDDFVNTPKDMELLVKSSIVTNDLGESGEACLLINNLGKRLFFNPDRFCFATLCEDLHKHCNRPWNKWKASLWQDYLNTPWAIVSVVAAAFLIILTTIQTVCSLISL